MTVSRPLMHWISPRYHRVISSESYLSVKLLLDHYEISETTCIEIHRGLIRIVRTKQAKMLFKPPWRQLIYAPYQTPSFSVAHAKIRPSHTESLVRYTQLTAYSSFYNFRDNPVPSTTSGPGSKWLSFSIILASSSSDSNLFPCSFPTFSPSWVRLNFFI